VNERKGGSKRTRLSLIALHAELRKQMSNIVALLFYRSCVRYADTPPMLVSLRVFLLLPSVVHRHSSIFFVIRVVVFYLLLYVNIEFLLRQKKRSKREENWSFGGVCVSSDVGMAIWKKASTVNFLIRIHRCRYILFSRCIYLVFSEQATRGCACRWHWKLLMENK
jgi:hypothetical protein